jgi:type I restriction enzyme S subunit
MSTADDIRALAPWADAMPTGWRVARLDAIADVLFSSVDKHTVDGEVPVRLCNYVDVYKHDRITSSIEFMEASAEERELRKYQIRRGDVLATKDSEEPDDIAISSLVAEELPGVLCGYHLAMIRPRRPSVSGPFLAWLHASKPFRAQYEAKAVGVTRFGLSEYTFRAARIPFPPDPEQQLIALYLDASCAAIDAAVATKRRQLDILEPLRRSIIERAVTHGIDPHPKLRQVDGEWLQEVPAHWEACRVKRVLTRLDYGISVSTVEEGRFPVLKMGHVQDGDIRFDKLDYVDEVDKDLILEEGDLLYNRTNSPDQVGKAAVFRKGLGDGITFASYLVRMRTNHRANPFFLNYVFNSNGFLDFARRLAIPSVQQSNLNSTRYARMFIPLPPLREQESIRRYLDERTGQMSRIVRTIRSQVAALTAYRNSLIHECVTGRRRVTDADLAKARAHG